MKPALPLVLAVQVTFFAFLGVVARAEGSVKPESEASSAVKGSPEIELGIGGVGGVYFLANPGELTVEVEKRDRNVRNRRTELRAVLAGPDRRVLQEVTIPDDGRKVRSGLGPAQRARLSTNVPHRGVYVLNVTVSQDRYGDAIVWGFRTNCPHYLIETSRGHRDERHQEPIVLANPDRPGNVCFLPPSSAFTVDVTGLPRGTEALQMFDAAGALIKRMPVNADRQVSVTFSADKSRGELPWRLHLPVQQAKVEIDGVTRWRRGDLYTDLSCWTPRLESFFPLQKYRWLLAPYSQTVYGQPGAHGELAFQIHNNSLQPQKIQLKIEFPGKPWPVQVSAERVLVPARRSQNVFVHYTMPASQPEETGPHVCHLRATPASDPDFSTYSTLIAKPGKAPAEAPLAMPIVLKPYEHENAQFGYLPDYPVDNQVYFDLKNHPTVRTSAGVRSWHDGSWASSELRRTVGPAKSPFAGRSLGMATTKVAFDADNDMYLLGTSGRQRVLLRSTDQGKTFSARVIPGREREPRAFDIEEYSGHNVLDGPPPILRYTRTSGGDSRLRWRRLNDLELFLPSKSGADLTMGDPILISKQCIGLAAHSGIPASVVSRGSKVHVVWAEATEPEVKVPGVPTFVVTYDRQACRLGEPVLVGYGAPPNDVHNTPSITMDSKGYLHVLAGTHGQPFQYARSLAPNDAHSGWTEAEPVGEGLRQTYIGFVCGPDDTLHLAFRLWWRGVEPFPASYYASLAYQRKRPGQPWEKPKVLVVPPLSEYSVFYHRLTIDRAGQLFLSYDYWSTFWFYRNDRRDRRRTLLMSPDGGNSWKLADSSDFAPGRE